VTGVRVERVQEISEVDAVAEGLHTIGDHSPPQWWPGYDSAAGYEDPRAAFGSLWRQINDGRDGCRWVDNPWVWVVGLRRTT